MLHNDFSYWCSIIFVNLFITKRFYIDASIQCLRVLQKQVCEDRQLKQLIFDVLLTSALNMVLITSHPRTIPSITPNRVDSTLYGIPFIQTPHVLLILNASIMLTTYLQSCKYGGGGPDAHHLKSKLVAMMGDSLLLIWGEITNKASQRTRGWINTSVFLADVNGKNASVIPFPQLEDICPSIACTTQMLVSL